MFYVLLLVDTHALQPDNESPHVDGLTSINLQKPILENHPYISEILCTEGKIKIGTGYEYDGNVFVAWVLQVRRAEGVTK